MKKRFLPLALGLSLALALPALAAAEAPQQTYEQAVAELRGQDGYQVETVYEADLCSVFSYFIGGTPHGSWAFLKLIYKAGTPLGEGTVINLPLHESDGFWRKTYAPDVIELSEDGKSLTYSYYFTLTGTELYTVELSTAEITTSTIPPTYEEIFEAHTWGYTVERQLEASGYSVVLMWSDFVGLPETERVRDYVLALISKENMEPEKQFQRLVLPSTTAVGEPAGYPTDRAPDSLTLSEDGSVLTYVYSFEDALYNVDGQPLHEAGTYTYTVDLATGELNVTHETGDASLSSSLGAEGTTFVDVSPEDWFAPYVDVCVEKGLLNGVGDGLFAPERVLSTEEALALAARLLWEIDAGESDFPVGGSPEEFHAFVHPADGPTAFGYELEAYQALAERWSWNEIYYIARRFRDIYGSGTTYFYALAEAATREQFFHLLMPTMELAGLPQINKVDSLPDMLREEDADKLYRLYETGIVVGIDVYGSADLGGSLTRAEAAALLARILEPSLRLSFSPVPLPTEGYALTYLMDGTPDCGITYPVCLLGEKDIMLTLDGQQLPWPVEGGVPSFALNPSGDYCYMGYWDESTDDSWDTKAGLIDRNGVYIVPPESGRKTTYAVDGGFFTEIYRESGTVWELLDEEGQFVRELEQIGDDPWVAYPPKGRNPLRGIDIAPNGSYYVDAAGTPVSQEFDWVGHITNDGQGFVGMDGKIYRIQFEK